MATHNVAQAGNGLGPKTTIVKLALSNMTSANLHTIFSGMTTGKEDDTAHVLAGSGTADGSAFVSGTTDVLFIALQGDGTYTAEGTNAHGVTGAVTTVECVIG